jgi:outer membrane protein TolC
VDVQLVEDGDNPDLSDPEGMMRGKLVGRCLLWLALEALCAGGSALAQTDGLPPALQRVPPPRPATGRAMAPATSNTLEQQMPYAPGPMPGPAEAGAPVGGTDAQAPRGLPINLATAMELAGVRPLDIEAATVQVRQSLALQLQARALLIPTLNAGVDYFRHDGAQQNIFTGVNFRKGRQDFFVGGGPSLFVGLTDAIYNPLVARRVVDARRADVQTARNDVLFTVSQAFFDLQSARGRLLGVAASIARAELLVNFTTALAPSLIAPLEINRAKAELESLRQDQQIAIRDWRVASARLAEILLLEPDTLLEPVEPPFLQVTLVSCDQTAKELVPVAVNNRPEISSRRELVAAAEALLRREQKRPFLPNLVVTSTTTNTGLLAGGNLSSGANGALNSNGSAFGIDVAAVWQLQNGGVGNVGRIREQRADRDLASIEFTRTVFRVKSEVTQAVARLQTARARVVATAEGLRQAIESADKNFIGLRETARPAGELLRLIVRPQEVVAAIIALETAYEQYAPAVNDYNTAQFDLYRALGQPAQWVTLGQWQPPASPPERKPAGVRAADGNGAPARP